MELRSYNNTNVEYSYNGETYFTFYVRTNEPYGGLLWYVDGDSKGGTIGDGNSQAHYFGLNLPGSIKGNTYEIEVFAVGLDPNGNLVLPTDNTDTETYDFTVLQPKWETEVHGGGGQQHPDVFGYVELTRHYFDGTNIIMEGYVFANNRSNETIRCSAQFKHTWNKNPFKPLEDDAPSDDVASGGSYGPHSTDTMLLNFPVGGLIGEGDSYTLNAHLHMITGLDHRHVDSTNTFDKSDNPEP